MSTATVDGGMRFCQHCGCHHGPACPRIKAIEYFENGAVKRVEYHDTATAAPPAQPGEMPRRSLTDVTACPDVDPLR